MNINFTGNNKNDNQPAVEKKCKLLEAIVKNADKKYNTNIWSRCVCNQIKAEEGELENFFYLSFRAVKKSQYKILLG